MDSTEKGIRLSCGEDLKEFLNLIKNLENGAQLLTKIYREQRPCYSMTTNVIEDENSNLQHKAVQMKNDSSSVTDSLASDLSDHLEIEANSSLSLQTSKALNEILQSNENEKFKLQLQNIITILQNDMLTKVEELKSVHQLREKQMSLAFVKLVAEMEIDNKRKVDELDVRYMEELLAQRQLTLSQAQTIRTQLKQLIEYQTRLSIQQATLMEHQNCLVLCHARLSHSQAQLMHYQAQLLLHQTQFMLLQTQILQQQQQQQQQQGEGEGVEEAAEMTSPPEP